MGHLYFAGNETSVLWSGKEFGFSVDGGPQDRFTIRELPRGGFMLNQQCPPPLLAHRQASNKLFTGMAEARRNHGGSEADSCGAEEPKSSPNIF